MKPIADWPGSASRWERAKQSLGGGVSTGMRAAMQPHPLFFERGQGSRLWDVDGHEYIDYVLGWGPVILGHCHPRLIETVTAQLPAGQTFGAGHHWEYEVAELVCSIVPGVERVLWSNTGSEAAQVALRLARAATGRQRFVKFEGHYHGWTDPMLLGYRPGLDGTRTGLASRGQHPRVSDDVTILAWNDIDHLRAVLADPANDIAAVFTEPVLCNSGVLAPADGFLTELRKTCDGHGVLLIFDEVITGFRIAYGGGAERYGVHPDLTIFAKALAGGFPLAAIGGRAELIDQVTTGVVHAGTYNGNPISLAAASVTLDELKTPNVYDTFDTLAAALTDGINQALTTRGIPGTAHHIGPVIQCALGTTHLTDVPTLLAADWALYDRLTIELLRRGVYTLPGGRWYLSTAHTTDDIEHTLTAFNHALDTITN